MATTLLKDTQASAFKALRETQGYSNALETPRIEKVVISVGIGSVRDKNKIKTIEDRLMKITGQKAAARAAKKSIASFKVRQGDTVGFQVTLRGKRLRDFIDRLINVALPRTRDFRGLDPKAVDEMGNLTVGIKEHTIFPETSDEDVRDVFGFAITVVTTAKNRKEALAYLTHLGFPFKA